MNRRTAKVVGLNRALAVVLPVDWTRGMAMHAGDLVDVSYNEEIVQIAPQKKPSSIEEGREVSSVAPARRTP